MSASLSVAAVIAAVVLAAVAALTYRRVRDTAYWRAAGEKLGRDYGIAPREDVTPRVGDYLRWQWLIGTLICIAMAVLFSVVSTHENGSTTTAAYCLFVAVVGTLFYAQVTLSSLRSWNRSNSTGRVAHLSRPTLSQTFTPAERNLLSGGLAFAALGGTWGLTRDGRPVLAALWLVVVIVHAWLGRWALNRVLNRPSHADDDLELGWDDVLRHKEARDLAAAIVWLPAGVALFLATHKLFAGANLVPFYLIALCAFLISRVFRRGRDRWLELWNGNAPTA